MESKLIIFDGALVSQYMNKEKLLCAIERSLVLFSLRDDGGVSQPVRARIAIPEVKGTFFSMPAYSAKDQAIAVKLLSVNENNTSIGLPRAQGTISLFDSCTGIGLLGFIPVEYEMNRLPQIDIE